MDMDHRNLIFKKNKKEKPHHSKTQPTQQHTPQKLPPFTFFSNHFAHNTNTSLTPSLKIK